MATKKDYKIAASIVREITDKYKNNPGYVANIYDFQGAFLSLFTAGSGNESFNVKKFLNECRKPFEK